MFIQDVLHMDTVTLSLYLSASSFIYPMYLHFCYTLLFSAQNAVPDKRTGSQGWTTDISYAVQHISDVYLQGSLD